MTGDTAGNYIRQYIIQRAKNALAAGSDVARVSYDLGFEYPQHFSRMFKKQTGITQRNIAKVCGDDDANLLF